MVEVETNGVFQKVFTTASGNEEFCHPTMQDG